MTLNLSTKLKGFVKQKKNSENLRGKLTLIFQSGKNLKSSGSSPKTWLKMRKDSFAAQLPLQERKMNKTDCAKRWKIYKQSTLMLTWHNCTIQRGLKTREKPFIKKHLPHIKRKSFWKMVWLSVQQRECRGSQKLSDDLEKMILITSQS